MTKKLEWYPNQRRISYFLITFACYPVNAEHL